MTTQTFLPDSKQVEAELIGALLIGGGASIAEIASFIRPEHFFYESYQAAYQAMLDMHEKGMVIDLVTIEDELQGQKTMSLFQPGELLDLIGNATSPAYAMHYAQLVFNKASDREAIRLAQKIVQKAATGQGQALSFASSLLEDATNRFALTAGVGPRFLDDILDSMLVTADELSKGRAAGKIVDIMFPWADLNHVIEGGLIPGDVMMVVGAPNIGKSTFVHQIADHATLMGTGVLLLTTETSAANFAARQLAPRAGVSSRKLLRGRLTSEEWERVMLKEGSVRRSAMMIDDMTTDVQLLDLRIRQAKAELAARNATLGLVVFDFLQLLDNKNYTDNRRLEVDSAIKTILRLAKEHSIAAIVVSEADKHSYRHDGVVHVSAAKESGTILYVVSIGVALNRTEDGRVVVAVEKNKDGKLGSFVLPKLSDTAAWFGSAEPYRVPEVKPRQPELSEALAA